MAAKYQARSLTRPGSSREIAIEIIAQVRESSMYLPAVQEVPYLDTNATILSRFCAIERLYDRCHETSFLTTIQFGFFFGYDSATWRETAEIRRRNICKTNGGFNHLPTESHIYFTYHFYPILISDV